MKIHLFKKGVVLAVSVLFVGMVVIPSTMSIIINKYNFSYNMEAFDGYILFSPMNSTITYLINNSGEVIHTWPSSYLPGYTVYLRENGSILRTAECERVEEIDKNGAVVWSFEYFTDQYRLHHDIEPLPNGNVLIIAWEYKTHEEIIAAGRDPTVPYMWPDHVIEVEPTGPISGDIVWEWHVWDHLIQDFDPTKENYGIVENHPELIDVNYGTGGDWLHTNSIDYNEEFDQILLSIHTFNEIWVIDHSTTTEEAAGHTGGNSGKGGDILYRWGNPLAYRRGTVHDQKFYSQHDARWIDSGCHGEGNILVFNNGEGRGYSSIDEIVPPMDDNGNYNLTPGSTFGPEDPVWIYTAPNPPDFYSLRYSGAQRLPSGNTLICNSGYGIFFETTLDKEIVWEYVNPYPNPDYNTVFTINHYNIEEIFGPDLDCNGSLSWSDVKPGTSVFGTFNVANIGEPNSQLDWEITEWPSWGTWTFNPSSGNALKPEDGAFTVNVDVVAPDEQNKQFSGTVKIINKDDSTDTCTISVSLATPTPVSHQMNNHPLLQKILEIFPNAFPILQQLLGL